MIERLLVVYRAMEMELTKLMQENEKDFRYTVPRKVFMTLTQTVWVERERVRDRIDELEVLVDRALTIHTRTRGGL